MEPISRRSFIAGVCAVVALSGSELPAHDHRATDKAGTRFTFTHRANHQRPHPEYVEDCFGCKVGELELSVGVANHRELPTAKQHDRELQSYYDATRQGIEPRSTKSKDIDAAVKLSNEAGKAFDGISMTFKE